MSVITSAGIRAVGPGPVKLDLAEAGCGPLCHRSGGLTPGAVRRHASSHGPREALLYMPNLPVMDSAMPETIDSARMRPLSADAASPEDRQPELGVKEGSTGRRS